MKVWIENSSVDINKLNGKSLFCKRLADEFSRLGIAVVDGDSEADVSINVIRLKHERSSIKILRINGVYHNTAQDYKRKNAGIVDSLKKADGVIYQSEFSRNMSDNYIGVPDCPNSVIFNGSIPEIYERAKPVVFDSKYNFITFSKWRPHKRLRDIIESYLLTDIPDSKLLILGEVNEKSGLTKDEAIKYSKNRNLVFCGMLPQNMLIPMLKTCTAAIHLCWFDACPNSVVESICAGVPVITNNVGGTWEIVAPSGGYVCNIDKPYDFKPVDLYHPPEIDRNKIAEALICSVNARPKITNDHVNIKNIAKQYLEFIESLL